MLIDSIIHAQQGCDSDMMFLVSKFSGILKKGYLEKMVVFDLSSRFKSKSTLFLLVVFCSITGILY